VTITDFATGAASTKPAHWVDANIHSVEVTAGIAACYLIHYLVDGYTRNDAQITNALRTRTFYIVPRVNPDGVEV
jgi:murein tripeptide amidase MpaA